MMGICLMFKFRFTCQVLIVMITQGGKVDKGGGIARQA